MAHTERRWSGTGGHGSTAVHIDRSRSASTGRLEHEERQQDHAAEHDVDEARLVVREQDLLDDTEADAGGERLRQALHLGEGAARERPQEQ